MLYDPNIWFHLGHQQKMSIYSDQTVIIGEFLVLLRCHKSF